VSFIPAFQRLHYCHDAASRRGFLTKEKSRSRQSNIYFSNGVSPGVMKPRKRPEDASSELLLNLPLIAEKQMKWIKMGKLLNDLKTQQYLQFDIRPHLIIY
jgi:hypothetical protein